MPAMSQVALSEVSRRCPSRKYIWMVDLQTIEYGHADVNIHITGNAHTDSLFKGLGDSMHGKTSPLELEHSRTLICSLARILQLI